MSRRALVLVLLAAVVLPASAQATVAVGLGDQKAATFADARVRALGLRSARLIVPWDAATSEPALVDQWLAAVAAAGMVPHVAFEHLRGDACPADRAPCRAPRSTAQRSGASSRASRQSRPTPRGTRPTTPASRSRAVRRRSPATTTLRAACPSCTVVAGDVLDSGSYASWLRRFLAASATTPQLWGLHDYGDVTYNKTTGVDTVLATVPGTLWVEETGGLVTLRNGAGRTTFSTTEALAAAAIDRAFALAATRPRIARMYVYEWMAFPDDAFDAGLVRPDGSARPSLGALQRNLAALGRAATDATAAPVRWSATWSKVRPRQVVLKATCPTTIVRCAGSIGATLRTRATGAARATFASIAGRRAYATTAEKRTVTLRISLSSRALRRARAAPTRRIVLAIAATRPSRATTKVTLKLARPR